MARKTRKPLIVIKLKRFGSEEEREAFIKCLVDIKRDYHVLVLAYKKDIEPIIEEYGTVTANGSTLRELKDQILKSIEDGRKDEKTED